MVTHEECIDNKIDNCPTLVTGNLRRSWKNIGYRVANKIGIPIADLPSRVVEQFLKDQRVKVILSEYLDQSLQWLPMAQRLGIPFFSHAHGYDVSRSLRNPKWQTEYLLYNQSSGVIVVSEASRSKLVNLGLHDSKIFTIPCGVDVPSGFICGQNNLVRCLAVGRMIAKKAPILLLDAFRKATLAWPNLHLDYVGTGEIFPAAKQYVQSVGLADRVTLHGEQSSKFVHDLMNKADIFVQHSMTDPDTGDEEGLPVAILEAMAQGLPVISTNHAGIPEAVVDGMTGFLVNEGDSTLMAEKIVSLASDDDLRQKFGSAGWRSAKIRFTWEKERATLLKFMDIE